MKTPECKDALFRIGTIRKRHYSKEALFKRGTMRNWLNTKMVLYKEGSIQKLTKPKMMASKADAARGFWDGKFAKKVRCFW